jgi:hypothetical protein
MLLQAMLETVCDSHFTAKIGLRAEQSRLTGHDRPAEEKEFRFLTTIRLVPPVAMEG